MSEQEGVKKARLDRPELIHRLLTPVDIDACMEVDRTLGVSTWSVDQYRRSMRVNPTNNWPFTMHTRYVGALSVRGFADMFRSESPSRKIRSWSFWWKILQWAEITNELVSDNPSWKRWWTWQMSIRTLPSSFMWGLRMLVRLRSTLDSDFRSPTRRKWWEIMRLRNQAKS